MIKAIIASMTVGIALAALVGCSQSPPQVNNYIDWRVVDQNVTGCDSIEPDALWVESLVSLPEGVETVPESVHDVRLELSGIRDGAIATLSWKAENRYGGTSQREEMVRIGKPEISDECIFTIPRIGR